MVPTKVNACMPLLLLRFAQRRPLYLGLAVDVPAELQPLAELAMVRQQAAAGGIDDPRRRGDVASTQRRSRQSGWPSTNAANRATNDRSSACAAA